MRNGSTPVAAAVGGVVSCPVRPAVRGLSLGERCNMKGGHGVRPLLPPGHTSMNAHAPLKLALVVAAGALLAVTAAIAQNPPSPTPQRGAPPSPTVPIPTGRQGRGGYPLPTLPAVFETYQHK